MSTNTLLDQMINNLKVTGISDTDKQKLAKLTFSQYSDDLKNADTAIGKLIIDNNLKIELLKLQVHYLHNLDAVKGAEKDKAIATGNLIEQLRNSETQLSDTQQQLAAVYTENTISLKNAKAQLEEKNAQLADVHKQYGALQTKLKVLTDTKGTDLQLNHSIQQSQQKPKDKASAVILTDDELKYITELKDKLSHNNFIPFKDFEQMFTIMYKYKDDIKKLLPGATMKNPSYTITYSNNPLQNNNYIIHIPINQSHLNINITNTHNDNEIVYVDDIMTTIITPIVSTHVKEVVANLENRAVFRICYDKINKLLDTLFSAVSSTHTQSKNKYLKYKNKYLQLKKLYNL